MHCYSAPPLWAASGTSFAKRKRFLRFFQNAYFPSTEFMGVHFFSPVWFLTRTLLQSRAWISILRKWQWKFQCKGLPLQFRTHNMYTSSLLSSNVHTIYILRYVANVCVFIENCTFRSSRPVVDDHNGNFLLKMALQLKYNLISRKWQFKFLPLDVPFCIAKVTPL